MVCPYFIRAVCAYRTYISSRIDFSTKWKLCIGTYLLFGTYPGFFSLAPILCAPKRHNSSGFKTLLSEQLTFEFFKVIYIRFALIL